MLILSANKSPGIYPQGNAAETWAKMLVEKYMPSTAYNLTGLNIK